MNELLAARLRQSIQGCSIHSHGPVQAWAAIQQECLRGGAKLEEVARLAIEACDKRIAELKASGTNDIGLAKEILTRDFIEKLLR